MIGFGGAARIRDWSKVNLVVDGDCLPAGYGASSASTAFPAQLAQLAPINGVISAVNVAVSGQTTRQMDGLDGGSATDVDGAFVAGKVNVLVVWGEPTNSICDAGRTAAQAFADLQSYIANRRATNKWSAIIIGTTLPRQSGNAYTNSQADIDTMNGLLASFNTMLLANHRSLGADAVFDVRQSGSPFAFADYSATSFAANNNLWNEGAGSRVYLTDAGYAIIAGYAATQMRRLPRHY